ncbi:hypothetical protein Q5752_005331 [Cryptotrichosporon argae]
MAAAAVFWAQFAALCRKNWIILYRHKWINILRCVLLPVAYAAFFAKAQDFFTTRGVFGPGRIAPLLTLPASLDGYKIVWAPPPSYATNATTAALVDALVAAIFDGITGDVVEVATADDIEDECPENFNLLSGCWAAFALNTVTEARLNYTIRGDYGLAKVDVNDHRQDDVQVRYLPLQWAIDSNYINLTTGTMPASPYSWEYTNETAASRSETLRRSYLRGIRSLIVLAFFLVFLGIVYQLPGSMASERAATLTAHLDAMGCTKAARVISWHLSLSAAYFPAWICVAAIFQHFVFVNTNAGLVIVLYLVTGLSLASWTYLVAAPFASAPTLAAITATFLAIVLAIAGHLAGTGLALELVLTVIFPPMFFIFMTKAIVSFELDDVGANILYERLDGGAPILALLLIALLDIVLFPLLAVWLESRLYGVPPPDGTCRGLLGPKHGGDQPPLPADVAVQITHLRKTYATRRFNPFSRTPPVVAIDDLSFAVPRGEIFCLLGRNGAAKSTTLSAIARLTKVDEGEIRYADGMRIGIASQKDVLWDELTCRQHVTLWRAIKTRPDHAQDEADVDLLARCDLGPKTRYLSKNLSGGQKRKLQLACALAGGSDLLLLDEITSGLDPLSRRAIWALVVANRGRTTIVLTTHFLDEADYLADHVAILKQPGQLLALDSPVALKHKLGKGYTIDTADGALARTLGAGAVRGKHSYATGTTELGRVRDLVAELRRDWPAATFQVNSATLEGVFLDLNEDGGKDAGDGSDKDVLERASSADALPLTPTPPPSPAPVALALTPGVHRAWPAHTARAAYTIFLKRVLILRRAWLLPLVGLVVVVCATVIPLFFMSDRAQTCARVLDEERPQTLTFPESVYPYIYSPVVLAPETAWESLTASVSSWVDLVPDNATFVDTLSANASGITYGGVSLASTADAPSTFAFEGYQLTMKGLSVLNVLSNAVLDQIRPPTANTIRRAFPITLNFEWIPSPSFESTGQAFKWIAFFGLGVAIWPAFACVYPTIERASNVRSNQYSNGASPTALWLGHLLFELPGILIGATLIVVLFATLSSQFNAPGDLWACFVLYGIAGTLWAYMAALFLDSALAAWALVAGVNVILFLLYLAAYMLILTYDRNANAPNHITIVHFTIGIINPVGNILRAALVSINMFSLLCDGLGNRTTAPYSSILQFGGPVLYLVLQAAFAFGVLVYVDSGMPIPAFLRRRRHKAALLAATGAPPPEEVVAERARVTALVEQGEQSGEALLVDRLKKRFTAGAGAWAVDDVAFGVGTGQVFALIGPNGAGKTTTLACIRGVEFATAGDVYVSGHSVSKARNKARAYLGVCPQVNAIDPNLTVRQHLTMYGRLKSVPRGALRADVDRLLAAAGLAAKADALATSLSGGNQRKLALAIALVGDREVVLIDEFSSGVDPFSKREAWATLAALTRDRAVVMTTHSMEEVDALATRVGIIASRLLTVGTPSTLKSRFATYEVHLASRAVGDALAFLRAHGFGDAARSEDTTTRISVRGVDESHVVRLLDVLDRFTAASGVDVALQEASTETAFLSIVREHNVQEEERGKGTAGRPWWRRIM